MSRKDYLDGLIQTGRDFKDHLWEHHQQRDMQAVIGFITDGGLLQVPDYIINKVSNDVDTVAEMVEALFEGVKAGVAPVPLDDVRGVVMIADAYSVVSDGDHNAAFDGEEDLIESFKNDPNTPVSESISAYVAERDVVGGCSLCVARLGYRLEDGGTLAWDDTTFYIIPDEEPGDMPWELNGPLYDVFRKYLSTEGLA